MTSFLEKLTPVVDINVFLASSDICGLLVTFANILDPLARCDGVREKIFIKFILKTVIRRRQRLKGLIHLHMCSVLSMALAFYFTQHK